jgi:hypothetical protein
MRKGLDFEALFICAVSKRQMRTTAAKERIQLQHAGVTEIGVSGAY